MLFWASRSFCQARILVGVPLVSPLLTPQEEFSSKTKARVCKLVASGLDPQYTGSFRLAHTARFFSLFWWF